MKSEIYYFAIKDGSIVAYDTTSRLVELLELPNYGRVSQSRHRFLNKNIRNMECVFKKKEELSESELEQAKSFVIERCYIDTENFEIRTSKTKSEKTKFILDNLQ